MRTLSEVFEKYPELGLIPSIMNYPIEVIKYVVLMYHKSSPFIKMFQDINTRKAECMAMAGLEEEQKELIDFSDINFIYMVSEFLKSQNSRLWSMIVSNEETFDEYQRNLMSEVFKTKDDKDKLNAILIKSKLMEDSDIISKRLDDYYRILFGDSGVAEFAAQKITPESIAKSTKK